MSRSLGPYEDLFMPGEDPNLNSLSRFSKKSERYILEAQSHCEVPAGCGGVVLRWRDPKEGEPITLYAYAAGSSKFFLDGQTKSSVRPVIPYGEHVLSIEVSDFNPSQVVLLFAAKFEDKSAGKSFEERSALSRILFFSAADGLWKYTSTEPEGSAWLTAGFDDSIWAAMPAREWIPDPAKKENGLLYQAEKILKMGAGGLGVDGNPAKVWIRRRFLVKPAA